MYNNGNTNIKSNRNKPTHFYKSISFKMGRKGKINRTFILSRTHLIYWNLKGSNLVFAIYLDKVRVNNPTCTSHLYDILLLNLGRNVHLTVSRPSKIFGPVCSKYKNKLFTTLESTFMTQYWLNFVDILFVTISKPRSYLGNMWSRSHVVDNWCTLKKW